MVTLVRSWICEILNLFHEMNTIVFMWCTDVQMLQSGERKCCIIPAVQD